MITVAASLGLVASSNRIAHRRCATSLMIAPAGPPSTEVWNDEIKEAWSRAYVSADAEHDYQVVAEGSERPAFRPGDRFQGYQHHLS